MTVTTRRLTTREALRESLRYVESAVDGLHNAAPLLEALEQETASGQPAVVGLLTVQPLPVSKLRERALAIRQRLLDLSAELEEVEEHLRLHEVGGGR